MTARTIATLGIAFGLLAMALAATVASAQAPGAPGPAQGADLIITAERFTFSPPYPTVPVGTTVTWLNRDREAHTITSDTGLFDAEIGPRETFRYTFDQPGAYFYFCLPHDWMIGEIAVVAEPDLAPETPFQGVVVTASQASMDVSMVGYEFQPASVTIEAGGSVTWTNFDPEPHTATATDSRSWTTTVLSGGQSETVMFAEPGTYPYLCAIHPSMTGEVVVTDPGLAAPSGG